MAEPVPDDAQQAEILVTRNVFLNPTTAEHDALRAALNKTMGVAAVDAPEGVLAPEQDILHRITETVLDELHLNDWELVPISPRLRRTHG